MRKRRSLLRLGTRIPGFRRLWLKFPVGGVAIRTEFDIWNRPAYAYGINSAAQLARSLGLRSITSIEFGVAGGNGLLSMERIAGEIAAYFGIEIHVVGFDTGSGMPPPSDYRDLPHVYRQGFYAMQPDRLRQRLRKAELILGNVADTTAEFMARSGLPPIGFVAFDFDYYSSTMDAFHVFAGPQASRLPRVFCYFDDVIGPERACHNEYVGELCAIRDYNREHETEKICKLQHLSWMRRHPAVWNEQFYVLHDFTHPLYEVLVTPEGDSHRQLALR